MINPLIKQRIEELAEQAAAFGNDDDYLVATMLNCIINAESLGILTPITGTTALTIQDFHNQAMAAIQEVMN